MSLRYFSSKTIDLIGGSSNILHYQIAAALATAYALPLPSTPVESAESYFAATLTDTATKVMEVFNELRPIQYVDAVESVKAFWRARYAVVHGSAAEQIAQGAGLVNTPLTLFGISYNLPKALLDEITECAEHIQPLYACITADIRRTDMIATVITAAV